MESQTVTPTTIRSRYIKILLNNPAINSLPSDQMRSTMTKIIADLDKDGILDPIDFKDDFDEIDSMSLIEFDTNRTTEEKTLALELFKKPEKDLREENEEVISLESQKRIRTKRRELSKDPRSKIILTPEDFEPDDERSNDARVVVNSYGRTPSHEAVGMRNLDLVKKYIDEGLYLKDRDNNGNTPYQMAYQEGFEEAVKLFEEAGITA